MGSSHGTTAHAKMSAEPRVGNYTHGPTEGCKDLRELGPFKESRTHKMNGAD
jgi:hypothetical protein